MSSRRNPAEAADAADTAERTDAGPRPAPDSDGERAEGAQEPDAGAQPRQELSDLITRGDESRAREARGERDAARRFLIRVHGDLYNLGNLAGRDQTWPGHPEGDIPQSLVPRERLGRVRAVFVPAGWYEDALRALRERRVVVLSGPPDLGKVTAALRLLLACEPGGPPEVRQVDPEVEPARLLALEPRPRCGYLVAGVGPGRARGLTAVVLDGVAQALASSGGYLVLTVDGATPLETPELGARAISCTTAPDPAALLDRHLDRHLGDTSWPRRASVRGDERVLGLLAERPAPRQVEHLAEELARVIRDDLPLETALSQVDVQVRKDVASWFAVHRGLMERAFIIAMAVLGGASYQAVLSAARRLFELLGSPEGIRDEDIFEQTRGERLRAVGAHAESVTGTTSIGPVPLEIVEFDSPMWQRTVLRFVWDEYDLVNAALLQWMRELCAGADPVVAARAAVALGELGRHDFGEIWRQILEDWARASSTRMRRGAAAALAIPAWDEALAPRVHSALLRWARDDADWLERWTAAAGFGVYYIGLRFPDDARSVLGRLLGADEAAVVGVAAESLASLFDLGRDTRDPYDYFASVLGVLERRSGPDEPKRAVRLASRLTFLKIAYESEVANTTARGRRWPTLLWLWATGDPTGRTAADLLRRALASKDTRSEALEVLERWLRMGSDDPELYQAIEGMVLAIVQSDRERVRLRVRLARWARDDGLASAAGSLLSRLSPVPDPGSSCS